MGPAITSSVLTAPRSRTRVSSRGSPCVDKASRALHQVSNSTTHAAAQGSDWLLNMRPDLKASEGFKLCLFENERAVLLSVCVSVHAICLLETEEEAWLRGRGLENCFDCCSGQ